MADAELERIAALEQTLEEYKTTVLPSIEAMLQQLRRSAYDRLEAQRKATRATRQSKLWRTIRGKIAELRAAPKYTELPADEPELEPLVTALRNGESVDITGHLPALWRFQARSGKTFSQYRIDGRRIEMDRLTGTYTLLAEWWQ